MVMTTTGYIYDKYNQLLSSRRVCEIVNCHKGYLHLILKAADLGLVFRCRVCVV